MPAEPWTQSRAIAGIQEPVVTRIGASPHHESFQLGALRTHLLTAAIAHAAACDSETAAHVRLRWDDTDTARATASHEIRLKAELTGVAGIPLASTDHQSGHQTSYRAATEALAALGLIRTENECSLLDITAVDSYLTAAGIDIRATIRSRLVNVDDVPVPQHQTVRLTRSSGTALWHLATVVDDIESGVNLVVRGTDKIDATAIQERIRAVLAPTRHVAYVFLPRVRPPAGAIKTRVAELLAAGIAPATLRWFLAENYIVGEQPVTTFDEVVDRMRPILPRSRDSTLDLHRLRAMDRWLTRSERRTARR